MKGQFAQVATMPGSKRYAAAISRKSNLYTRQGDIRTPFGRDYTRILHSTAYRRLKHKTQVFFSPENDHISTRIEHVNYVDSIASTICEYLGLNLELTRAIAIGHDVGHPPFGHHGEQVINALVKREEIWPGCDGQYFFHEKNGLRFVDSLELLEGPDRRFYNLDLTYGVRDGIISHCGEITETALKPREEAIPLSEFQTVNAYAPFTWEGCIVKYADKISYLGRDIEDALKLEILSDKQLQSLDHILKIYSQRSGTTEQSVNNTTIIHTLVMDLCYASTAEKGICFSEPAYALVNAILEYNYHNIYTHHRLEGYKKYGELIINQVYENLMEFYQEGDLQENLVFYEKHFPVTITSFKKWLNHYSDEYSGNQRDPRLNNAILYHIKEQTEDYKRAVIDFISGMTDIFIEKIYQELIRF